MDLEARIALVRQVGEEIVTEEELRALLAAKEHPVAYDGFEPSGTAHIAQGVMRAINVNKMTRAGFRFKMFVADWHAWANNKMGGDLERIQVTGKYLIEVWRATGMDLGKVDFVWASEFIEDESYWKRVMNIARETSLDRALRTTQIMGRSEKEKLSAAQILYPCMQAADIFHLEADATQLGMDQRKVNMLAREVGPRLGFWKPVVVSHHMLMGLTGPPAPHDYRTDLSYIMFQFSQSGSIGPFKSPRLNNVVKRQIGELDKQRRGYPLTTLDFDWVLTKLLGLRDSARSLYSQTDLSEAERVEVSQLNEMTKDALNRVEQMKNSDDARTIERATALKMSKSNPDSAIFMTDTPEQVQAKIKKAYCPEKQAQDNPILEYYRYIIFERFPSVTIERPAKFGGDLDFASYAELEQAFVAGKLHPMDAKNGAAKHINMLLDPVREHFAKDPHARRLKEQVDSFKVTR